MIWEMFTGFATMYLSYLIQNDPDGFEDRVSTRRINDLLPSYDFIIVGAGSAGSVVANRLSENKNWNILLVEAGGQENDYSRTPAIFPALVGSRFNWNYTTVPQKKNCKAYDGVCPYPRGRALGGSSSVNGMMFLRGYRSDYDKWGNDNPGWNFDGVHSYFLKSQDNKISGLKERGTKGPITITSPGRKAPIIDSIMQAGQEMGWKKDECMEFEKDCIEYVPVNIRDGRRCSASTAFLESSSKTRENLHIITGARVTKVSLDGTSASGIEFTSNQEKFTVKATREVVVSAGTIDSPKLLMLSGIGPKDHLESLGINVITDLPVGNNLQDHGYTALSFEASRGTWTVDDLNRTKDEYVKSQTGPLSSNGYAIVAYTSLGKPGKPVIQYLGSAISDTKKKSFSMGATIMNPESRGTIRLRSSDPTANPLIDVNFFSKENDYDLALAGLKNLIKLFQASSLKSYNVTISPVDPCAETNPTEKYLRCLMGSFTEHGHPVGTIKMSPRNKGGVVDNRLKVYGIDKLRVIDASIAPTLISVNTNAMAIMIGEKGADIIKEDYQ